MILLAEALQCSTDGYMEFNEIRLVCSVLPCGC